MKIIAYYLPQFHELEINNKMWGKGFTEWTNVKKAKPLFEGHEQPVSPLNDFYYDLTDTNVMRWQAKIAKENGIYGFCFYHYWYNGELIMEKPIENYLSAKDIDFPYCICWANHNWTTSWGNSEFTTVLTNDYSNKEDWKAHFLYLLPYLKDERYIKINGKPLVVIYDSIIDKKLNKMLDAWQLWARENGLPGISFAYQEYQADLIKGLDLSRYDYDIEYQPQYVRELIADKKNPWKKSLVFYLNRITFLNKLYKKVQKNKKSGMPDKINVVDYEEVWSQIINMKPTKENSVPGAFIRMDTTPRIGKRGYVTQGMTVESFGKYLRKQIINCRDVYKKDFMFIFAWNEWAEGGYLEPDKKNGYDVLNEIKNALIETNEFPW